MLDSNASFLPNGEAVLKAAKQLIDEENNDYLYICGSSVKYIINQILFHIDIERYQDRAYIALPSLTGRDFLNASFLYQLNKLAMNIHISNKAIHNMILTPSGLLFISVGNVNKSMDNEQICGVLIREPSELETARIYCNDLWSAGFPLHLGRN